MKPIVVVLLIDFEGHPVLSNDEVLNNLRFSHLKSLIFNPYGNLGTRDHKFLFLSNHTTDDKKMCELHLMSEAEGWHEWVMFDPVGDFNPQNLNKMINDKGYSIQNIIIGGCNTAGCVLGSTKYSSVSWAKAGFPVQIFLPMCADYQYDGATTYESQMIAISSLFRGLKETKTFDKIEVITNINHLNLIDKTMLVSNWGAAHIADLSNE